MELLVLIDDHWSDKVSGDPTKEARLFELRTKAKFEIKYQSRHRKGDIIEVKSDGFWTGPKARGYRKDKFKVVSVPGVNRFDLDRPMNHTDGTPIYCRRYSISTTKKTLTEQELDEALIDKDDGLIVTVAR